MKRTPPATIETLADLRPGEEAIVTTVKLGKELALRLQEMGFVPGSAVRIVRRAPLGDPLQVDVRGYQVSLRSSEAALIVVERKKEAHS